MVSLDFRRTPGSPLKVLCLGAHADDIEIGCAGTLWKLLRAHPGTIVWWVVFSAEAQRAREARHSARILLEKAGQRRVILGRFTDSFFPHEGARIKRFMHRISDQFAPDLVFTHRRDDLHQDHRTVAELTGNAFRDHLVLEYEIPKYDADLGVPNVYVTLDRSLCARKARHVLECFPSQRPKSWFTEDTFRSLMRLRGVESGNGFAEGFYCRKMSVL